MNLIANIETYNLPSVILDSNNSRSQQARVSIAIYDPVTGNPTNGNNCKVTYKLTDEFNNTSTLSAFVPGLSVVIYEGEVGRVIFDRPYHVVSSAAKKFEIVSITGGEVPLPPPPPGDIQIISLDISPETSSGAHNGQVTINASATYLPLGYAIDGITSQASPIFTGLAGGTHTIVITDANGQTSSKTFYIPTVNNLLVSDPSVTLPGGNISRWNAAFNPVVFTYQRKDFYVTDLQLHTINGKTRVVISDDASAVTAGDLIYIETPACTGTFKVTEKYANNILVIDTPFTAGSTGFININRLRPYYKILTRVTFFDKLTGTESSIISTNRPNNKGITKADISNFLQSLLRAKDASDYTQSNYRDDNLSASYKIAYAEEWEGHTPVFNFIDHPYYVVYAAKQLGERYGGNLAAYVPFSTAPNGADKARWITDFAEPAYSNNYPFDISFIYSEDMVGRDLYGEFTLLDINRNPLPGGPQIQHLLNDDGSWLLTEDGSKFVIADQNQLIVQLPEQLGLNRLLIPGPFAEDVYYLDVALKYDDSDDVTHTVTQKQTIRVDDAIDDQSVYLRWIGLSGSWNYYRFIYNQEVSLDVQNAVIIKNYVSDWEHQDSIEEVISKTAGQKVKVVAEDLSVADIKGLQSIKYSPKVQMLVNKNPVKWQTIVINTATYSEYETRNGQAPFSVTFNMPAINIQVQ
ncbi:hypothetical protein GWR56_11220 [Mucilaginibacter sp. 14171R-50]|uniref:hypothetical protein n=1 Tax=Mucilaginibacter sp. 14171R-50 TaxID=2703789 RepID=UPI00138D2DA0|nr:hypothetical protein [Mucilaginibacter sp. 14171R-50]QHS56076.1 hypothetical protein GWR56_11220 [Mucilaginibacter sp. 14171R-50]